MNINTEVIEKLLFPLHKKVYEAIDDIIEKVKATNPDIVKQLCDIFELESNAFHNKELGFVNKPMLELNIKILFSPEEDLSINNIEKSQKFSPFYTLNYCNAEQRFLPTSDLIIHFFHKKMEQNFIVPLAFIFGFNQERILSGSYYQVYTHQLYSKESIEKRLCYQLKGKTNLLEMLRDEAYTYIGITKRNWKKRYQEHLNSSRNGSFIRFHRCLRGDFFKIAAIDHIIDKAGLTEDEAMEIEEKNVEQVSLYPFFPKGLNMIPGGKAGLKCIHEYARRTGYKIENKLEADIFESELVKIQNHIVNTLREKNGNNYKNEKIAELWAQDLEFRIKAITNQEHHFSYEQIKAARLLSASGWEFEKIFNYLKKLDSSKFIKESQLKDLLDGKTYQSIPDLLL